MASPAVDAAKPRHREGRVQVARVARGSDPVRISAEVAGVVEVARARAEVAALAAKVAEARSAAVIEWSQKGWRLGAWIWRAGEVHHARRRRH